MFQQRVTPVPAQIVSPAPRGAWDTVYRSDPRSMPSHSPCWVDGVVATGRFLDASRYYSFSDGVRAVLPLFATRAMPHSFKRLLSPPSGWGYGGTISTEPLTPAHFMTVLADLASDKPFEVSLRPNPFDSAGWNEAADSRWKRLERTVHVLDLEGGFEKTWRERFRPRTRTTIRKAERANLDIESGNDARLVDEFYGLLKLSFGRWAAREHRPIAIARWNGQRRDPASRFHLMAKVLGPLCRVWVARHEGMPAAAIFVLQDRNAHYTRGAMNERVAGPTAAAYLLHRLAIEAACDAGCRHYHMGDTGKRPTLAQFKTRFGAVEMAHVELRLERLPLLRINSWARGVLAGAVGVRHA